MCCQGAPEKQVVTLPLKQGQAFYGILESGVCDLVV